MIDESNHDEFLKDWGTMHIDAVEEKYHQHRNTLRYKAKQFGFKGPRKGIKKHVVPTHPEEPITGQVIAKAKRLMSDGIENYPRLTELITEFNKTSADMGMMEEARLTKQLHVANQIMSECVAECTTKTEMVEGVVGVMRLAMQRLEIMAKGKKESDIGEEQLTQIRKEAIIEAFEGVRSQLTPVEARIFDAMIKRASQKELDERKKALQAQHGQLNDGIEEAEYTESSP